jgi:UDP-N-acetylglucosamine diphosphorylase / glucose-1-phosphate thymidylyltransferase / UDP-N-acetylgalactosamine diphosphorylase / glucosamine-1-phosphate N-acetyltransferase / galactosamine-1-phosphate N-acetyltransferase
MDAQKVPFQGATVLLIHYPLISPMSSVGIDLPSFIEESYLVFPTLRLVGDPWDITAHATKFLTDAMGKLSNDFVIRDGVAIHRQATIESGVILKGPIIVSKGCFIAAHAYLRGGVFLGEGVTVGPGCEVKSSFVFSGSALAHFNFVGDSILGSRVNMEAGSILANHYNEREDKKISVWWDGQVVPTGSTKFGALVGDHTRIGANAVTSPGTLLPVRSVVERLELVRQVKSL